MRFELGQDLRYAARTLRHSPPFTLVAVLTLGLGIGANTAIFSVVEAVILRPLPWSDPGRLVSVWEGSRSRAEFVGVRERARTLAGVAAYRDRVGITLSGAGEPARLSGAQVSAELLRVLGESPALGRGFTPGEDRPGVAPVAVLSDGLWRARFGADSAIVGRTIELDGVPHTVVGVMPADFWFPRRDVQVWVPLVLDPAQTGPYWGQYGQYLVGRLAPGATRGQARAEVLGIAQALRLENPVWRPAAEYYVDGLDVVPLVDHVVPRGSRRLLLLLLAAVGLVLVIACANVANLVIARGVARERELSLRTALGAGRGRLVRQLLTESAALSALGGALGLALAFAGSRALVGLLPADTPRLAGVGVNGWVLAFTAAVAALAGVGFGLVPALRLSRPDLSATLGDRGGQGGGAGRHRRLAGGLVIVEIALAVVLAVATGLLLKSFARTLAVDPGFRTERVVTARISPPRAHWTGPGFGPQSAEVVERQRVFYQELVDRLRASPAVSAAAVTNQAPFEKVNEAIAMWVDGYTTDPNRLEMFDLRKVSPEYFRTMRMPVLAGRGIETTDGADTPLVAVIDQTAADRYYQGRDPIGARIRFPWPGWITVVGVVPAVAGNDLTGRPQPTVYVPFPQYSQPDMTVIAVTTGGAPGAAQEAIRRTVRELAPDVPVSDERTMGQRIDDSVAEPRFAARLLLAFGLLALGLGAVGTYGLLAYRTARRSRELAVRMALGARPGHVLRAVMREGAVLAAAGVGAGLLLALGLTRLLRGMLFDVSTGDPATYGLVALVLSGAALLASLVPARRATRVDPMTAMRAD